jgi:hypothetical protein
MTMNNPAGVRYAVLEAANKLDAMSADYLTREAAAYQAKQYPQARAWGIMAAEYAEAAASIRRECVK